MFYNNDIIERKFKAKIIKIYQYDNFEIFLRRETLKKCLPGYTKIQDGILVYHKYFSEKDEITYKVKSFHIDIS